MISHTCRSSGGLARCAQAVAAAIAITTAPLPALAQTYPDHTVRIIVPFPAGGTADAMPRLVGDWLSRKWKQPVVIENRTGAAGNIGSEQAYKAASDGYTLLSSPAPPLVINQNLYPKLGFDPTKFEPVIVMAEVPNALIVNPDRVKANTVPEFIAYLKANPGKITSATQGNGTTSHLTSEMFQMMAGVKVQHIPYRGSAPALHGLLAGNVDFMFDNLGASRSLIEGGKLKLIAVATSKRLASMPKVPTIAETLPGFASSAWFAVVAPPKTPQAIVQKLNADINEALRQPEIIAAIKKLTGQTVGGGIEETAKYMKEDTARWKKVIDTAHVKL